MMKTKKFFIIFIICLLITGIFFSIYSHTILSQKVVKNILEKISETSLLTYQTYDFNEYEDSIRHEYSHYFTETGINQALARRYFSRFFDPEIQINDIQVEDVSLSHSKWAYSETTINGTFKTVYTTIDHNSLEDNWHVTAQLNRVNGKWLVNSIRID